MSATTELVGDGYAFTHHGKEYRVGLITQKLKSDFEKFVWEREKVKLLQYREFLPEDIYRERALALADKHDKGGFAMFNPDDNPLNKQEYALLLYCLMTGLSDVELAALLADPVGNEKAMSCMNMAMRESFPAFALAQDGQKKTAPTATSSQG